MTPEPIHVTPGEAKRLQRNLKKAKANMTSEEHKKRHEELHKSFDELLADFIEQTGKVPSKTTLMEFLEWSYEQTQHPTEKKTT